MENTPNFWKEWQLKIQKFCTLFRESEYEAYCYGGYMNEYTTFVLLTFKVVYNML